MYFAFDRCEFEYVWHRHKHEVYTKWNVSKEKKIKSHRKAISFCVLHSVVLWAESKKASSQTWTHTDVGVLVTELTLLKVQLYLVFVFVQYFGPMAYIIWFWTIFFHSNFRKWHCCCRTDEMKNTGKILRIQS